MNEMGKHRREGSTKTPSPPHFRWPTQFQIQLVQNLHDGKVCVMSHFLHILGPWIHQQSHEMK